MEHTKLFAQWWKKASSEMQSNLVRQLRADLIPKRRLAAYNRTPEYTFGYPEKYSAEEVLDFVVLGVSPQLLAEYPLPMRAWKGLKELDRKFEYIAEVYKVLTIWDFTVSVELAHRVAREGLARLSNTFVYKWNQLLDYESDNPMKVSSLSLQQIEDLFNKIPSVLWLAKNFTGSPTEVVQKWNIVSEQPRCKCQINLAEEESPCPYSAEIRGVTEICTCCTACRQACSDDV